MLCYEDDECDQQVLTIVTVPVPLHVGDHAGHVDHAEEARGLAHLQCQVLRGGDIWQAAHLY